MRTSGNEHKSHHRSYSQKQARSLGGQFRNQLNSLLQSISKTQSHFIRTVKPNVEKACSILDRPLLMRQLTTSGVMDTIRVRQMGYDCHVLQSDFLNSYKLLLSIEEKQALVHDSVPLHDLCKQVINRLAPELESAAYQLGNVALLLVFLLLPFVFVLVFFPPRVQPRPRRGHLHAQSTPRWKAGEDETRRILPTEKTGFAVCDPAGVTSTVELQSPHDY
jgi:hypothetical protein